MKAIKRTRVLNHSPYLIKLKNNTCYPEGNFGGNPLLDGSISVDVHEGSTRYWKSVCAKCLIVFYRKLPDPYGAAESRASYQCVHTCLPQLRKSRSRRTVCHMS